MITDEQLAEWRALCERDATRSRKRSESSTDVAFAAMPLLLDEVARLRANHADDQAILADYQAGRIRTCPEHGIAIIVDDPVERENEQLRAEVERLRAESTDEIAKLRRSEADGWREAKEAQAEVAQLRAEAVDLSADLHAREERAMAAEAEVERLRASVLDGIANNSQVLEENARLRTEVEALRADIRRMVGCPTDAERAAERERIAAQDRLAAERDSLRSEVEAMRPVVDAADEFLFVCDDHGLGRAQFMIQSFRAVVVDCKAALAGKEG